jgi:hypothetical protein
MIYLKFEQTRPKPPGRGGSAVEKIPQYAAGFEGASRVKQVATVCGKTRFTMMGFAGVAERRPAPRALAFV